MTSATTPILFSSAATLTPAMLMIVASTIRPSVQGSASAALSKVTPNQPAMNGEMLTEHAVTATVWAISSHQPVCQASHGLPGDPAGDLVDAAGERVGGDQHRDRQSDGEDLQGATDEERPERGGAEEAEPDDQRW